MNMPAIRSQNTGSVTIATPPDSIRRLACPRYETFVAVEAPEPTGSEPVEGWFQPSQSGAASSPGSDSASPPDAVTGRRSSAKKVERSLNPTQARAYPSSPGRLSMVHTISLGAALLIVLVALVLLFVIGPLGLLILILAVVLFWYAFGPGASNVRISG